jgi:hypothetical protein
MSDLPAIEPFRTAPDIVEEMIHASDAKSADRLTIAGRGSLDLLIGLCRRGFGQVSCRAADQGPHAGEPPADVLWIPEVESEAHLLTVMARLGRALRSDGVLLIRQRRRLSKDRSRRLGSLLAECGFTLERQTATVNGSMLFRARKRAREQAPCAA